MNQILTAVVLGLAVMLLTLGCNPADKDSKSTEAKTEPATTSANLDADRSGEAEGEKVEPPKESPADAAEESRIREEKMAMLLDELNIEQDMIDDIKTRALAKLSDFDLEYVADNDVIKLNDVFDSMIQFDDMAIMVAEKLTGSSQEITDGRKDEAVTAILSQFAELREYNNKAKADEDELIRRKQEQRLAAEQRAEQLARERLAARQNEESGDDGDPLIKAPDAVGAWRSIREESGSMTVNHNDDYYELWILKYQGPATFQIIRQGEVFSKNQCEYKYDAASGILSLLSNTGEVLERHECFIRESEPNILYMRRENTQKFRVYELIDRAGKPVDAQEVRESIRAMREYDAEQEAINLADSVSKNEEEEGDG